MGSVMSVESACVFSLHLWDVRACSEQVADNAAVQVDEPIAEAGVLRTGDLSLSAVCCTARAALDCGKKQDGAMLWLACKI